MKVVITVEQLADGRFRAQSDRCGMAFVNDSFSDAVGGLAKQIESGADLLFAELWRMPLGENAVHHIDEAAFSPALREGE